MCLIIVRNRVLCANVLERSLYLKRAQYIEIVDTATARPLRRASWLERPPFTLLHFCCWLFNGCRGDGRKTDIHKKIRFAVARSCAAAAGRLFPPVEPHDIQIHGPSFQSSTHITQPISHHVRRSQRSFLRRGLSPSIPCSNRGRSDYPLC